MRSLEWKFLLVGGGLGLFMGLFLGALDNPIMQDEMTGRQQFIYTAKQMGRRSWSSCKAFAIMGLVFSAAECVAEKVIYQGECTNKNRDFYVSSKFQNFVIAHRSLIWVGGL